MPMTRTYASRVLASCAIAWLACTPAADAGSAALDSATGSAPSALPPGAQSGAPSAPFGASAGAGTGIGTLPAGCAAAALPTLIASSGVFEFDPTTAKVTPRARSCAYPQGQFPLLAISRAGLSATLDTVWSFIADRGGADGCAPPSQIRADTSKTDGSSGYPIGMSAITLESADSTMILSDGTFTAHVATGYAYQLLELPSGGSSPIDRKPFVSVLRFGGLAGTPDGRLFAGHEVAPALPPTQASSFPFDFGGFVELDPALGRPRGELVGGGVIGRGTLPELPARSVHCPLPTGDWLRATGDFFACVAGSRCFPVGQA